MSAETPPTPPADRAGFPWVAVALWAVVGAVVGGRAGGKPHTDFLSALWATLEWGWWIGLAGGLIGLGFGLFAGDTARQRVISGLSMFFIFGLALFVASLAGVGMLNFVGWLTGDIGMLPGALIGAALGASLPAVRWALGRRG